jgi:Ca2+-binding RTX toxin-like protein
LIGLASAVMRGLLLLVVFWLPAQVAFAQTVTSCSNGEPFAAAPCGGTCSLAAGSTLFRCFLDVGGSSAGAIDAVVVEDYALNGDITYSAWGRTDDGAQFCCFVDDDITQNIVIVQVFGSNEPNNIYFTDFGTRNVESVQSYAYGDDGADTIFGSDFDASYLLDDFLYGEGGADFIDGLAGDDYIEGNLGADELEGGADNDTIYGGAQDDEILGEGGVDTIDGEDGVDTIDGGMGDDGISGGPGADVLWGGNGDDHVCGDNGTGDSINGGPPSGPAGSNNDQLWAPSTAVSPTGSVVGNNANCGDNGAGFGAWAGNVCGSSPCCTYNLTTKPANCP